MPPERTSIRIGILLLLVVVFASSVLAETDVRSYRRGRRALETGDTSMAVDSLLQAIAADPREGLAKVRGAGVVYEDYLPYFYLGIACERSGRRDEAFRAYTESARQAVVVQRPELRRQLEEALRRLSPPPTTTMVAEVARAPVETRDLPPTPSPAPAIGSPPPSAPPTAPPARPPASEQAPGPTDRLAPDERIALRAGVRAYFEGDHERAIALLSGPGERFPGTRLLLAYALATRFVLSSERPAELLARAQAVYAAARASGAADADPRVGSPALRLLLAGPGARQKRTTKDPTTR